ncbi:putative ribonuclease H-like domain-containing protein [Tanacetum coccineum]
MKIEHYLAHTDYPIWEVIQNGNGPVSVTLDTTGQIKILPPKTAEEMVLRERERKARTTLLMAIPEDHLAKFHKMTDAKDISTSEATLKDSQYPTQMEFKRIMGRFQSTTQSARDSWSRNGLEMAVANDLHENKTSRRLNEKRRKTRMDGILGIRKEGRETGIERKHNWKEKKKLRALVTVDENDRTLDSGNLSYENEAFSVSLGCNASDYENPPLHKRFIKTCEMQAVPPPMTGNYLPSGPDVEIDDSKYTYGPEKTQPSEPDSQTNEVDACDSNISTETSELVFEPVVNESHVEVQPKVWSDAPIIEEYESIVMMMWRMWKSHRILRIKGILDSGCSRNTDGKRLPSLTIKTFEMVALLTFGGGLGHVNFKNLNRLVKGNLVRGLPTKLFQNDHTCVACQKGKQHKASCKAKFSWTFFLRTKDETSAILKDFIRQIENQLNQKVKTIRCDNGTEFKNRDIIEFCGLKGIKREYSNARTPQQNGVAERKNRTLIEAARTRLQIFFTYTFWAEAVNHLGKFAGKSDEGFLVGYSLQSKAFRVYNLVTKRVEENLHIKFLENKPNVAGKGPNWLFDLDYLTDSMNYLSGILTKKMNCQGLFEVPLMAFVISTNTSSSKSDEKRRSPREEEQVFLDDLARLQRQEKEANEEAEALTKNLEQDTEKAVTQAEAAKTSSTNIISTVSTTAKASGTNFVNTVSIPVGTASANEGLSLSNTTNSQEDDYEIPPLEDIHEDATDGIFTHSSYDDEGAVADFTNLETIVNVSPIPTSRVHPSHPSTLILGDPTSAVQTRSKVNKSSEAHAFVSYVQKQRRTNHKDFHHCLFACFLSQLNQEVQIDLPYGKKAIGTKWVYRNKKDERGVVVRNKARLVCLDTDIGRIWTIDEVFALVSKPKSPQKVFKVVKALYGYIKPPKSWFQVTPKTSHLTAVKRIFRYLKGKPKLGLWYPRESTFDLESYSDSDYARANLDRKSTTGGCQFLGRRLITWQCKKQTIVATSTTEAEYVAAASCCGQVLWISKSNVRHGFKFHEHKIYLIMEAQFAL